MSRRGSAQAWGAMGSDVRPQWTDRSASRRLRGLTRVVELLRARTTGLPNHPADPRADARPVETRESRVVRSLMVGLLPAGWLWLTVFSLLRGLFG